MSESLRARIERWIQPPEGSRGGFEDFWKKARPRIRHDAMREIFVLPDDGSGLD